MQCALANVAYLFSTLPKSLCMLRRLSSLLHRNECGGKRNHANTHSIPNKYLIEKMNAKSKQTLINKRCPEGGAHFPLVYLHCRQCILRHKANEHVTHICVKGSHTHVHFIVNANKKQTNQEKGNEAESTNVYTCVELPHYHSDALLIDCTYPTIHTNITFTHTQRLFRLVRHSQHSFGCRDRCFVSIHFELVG